MAHKVEISIPFREIGKKDVKFIVRDESKKFGALRVSKGAVVWFPRSSQKGYKLTWQKFNDLMIEHGYKSEYR